MFQPCVVDGVFGMDMVLLDGGWMEGVGFSGGLVSSWDWFQGLGNVLMSWILCNVYILGFEKFFLGFFVCG